MVKIESQNHKKGTIPVYRGAFKSHYLNKHSSLLRHRASSCGILISCQVGSETRAIGIESFNSLLKVKVIYHFSNESARSFLQSMMDKLFCDSKAVWPEVSGKLDIDLEIIGLSSTEQHTSNSSDISKIEETTYRSSKSSKKFQLVDTGCGGVIFIQFRSSIIPSDFITCVFNEINHTQIIPHTISHCSVFYPISFHKRFIPIDHLCPSDLKSIEFYFSSLIRDFFSKNKGVSVCVLVEIRNNLNVNSDSIKKVIFGLIPDDMQLTVDLKNPDYVVLINVFKSICGLSFLPLYFNKYKKYNLSSLLLQQDAIKD